MNIYRGCHHNCAYCDGRSEGYYVEGEFGEDVAVKVNAPEVLRRELDPRRKRKPFKRGYIMMGGGVGDSYQPVEREYELARQILSIIYEHNFPVHILTKSTLVKRDIDILKKINQQNRAIVSFSFSSVDEKISSIFEPSVPSPTERLDAIAFLKNEGISCGMFLMPVIPLITDSPTMIEAALVKGKEAGIDFVIFGGMTLKDGRQRTFFSQKMAEHYPELLPEYHCMYKDDKWGRPVEDYSESTHRIFDIIADQCKIPKRIPLALFKNIVDRSDLVVVILEHMDYLLKLRGEKSPFGYAAHSISQLKVPLPNRIPDLMHIEGVGKRTERTIREILDTGNSTQYQKLMNT